MSLRHPVLNMHTCKCIRYAHLMHTGCARVHQSRSQRFLQLDEGGPGLGMGSCVTQQPGVPTKSKRETMQKDMCKYV